MNRIKLVFLTMLLVSLMALSPLVPVLTSGPAADASFEVTPATRIPATVQNIQGFGTPTWLLDNKGRAWVNALPLDTYVVFKLSRPYSHMLFQWMASANYDYTVTQYGAPTSYDIQVSSDSADGVSGNWVTVANVQNNAVAARAHEITAANVQWVRFRVTGGGSSIDEIDIHDLSQTMPGSAPDTWGFIGDSITADSFWRNAEAGMPFNQWVNEADPERYPSMINFGIGGQNAQHLLDRLQQTIDLNQGVHFWAVGIGTNGNGSEFQYESCLREIIRILLDNGKQPIVARIPFSRDASMDNRIQQYNVVVDALTKEYGLPAGPDLYAAFKAHSEDYDNANSYFRDPLHPNNKGVEAINRLWAEVARNLATGSGNSSAVIESPQSQEAQSQGSSSQEEQKAQEPQELQSQGSPLTPGENRFYVDGTRIIAPDGSDFLIKGVNINGPGWCFPRDTLQDVGLIAETWKFNSVRLCTATKWLQAYGNEDLDAIITAFTSRDIVVIIENHDYTGIFPTDQGYYHHWDDQDNYRVYINPLSQFAEWWIDKAERYKDDPYVWFNIMNEPGPNLTPPIWQNAEQSAKVWYAVHDELIRAIRGTGAENIIVIDEHNWGQGNGYQGGGLVIR